MAVGDVPPQLLTGDVVRAFRLLGREDARERFGLGAARPLEADEAERGDDGAAEQRLSRHYGHGTSPS